MCEGVRNRVTKLPVALCKMCENDRNRVTKLPVALRKMCENDRYRVTKLPVVFFTSKGGETNNRISIVFFLKSECAHLWTNVPLLGIKAEGNLEEEICVDEG